MSMQRNVREVICAWVSCLMTIGFEDISQNRVLNELVRDAASCWLALAFFFSPHFATFASGGGKGRRGRCDHKHLLKLGVVEI